MPAKLLTLAAAALIVPASAYVAQPAPAGSPLPGSPVSAAAAAAPEPVLFEEESAGSSPIDAALASFGISALIGWLRTYRKQAAAGAAAAAIALAPAAAPAMIDYDGVKYLGGSDQVDINNANVQAYRQFPGMYPTAAGAIATHGPYKEVSDVFNIPNLPPKVIEILKKYEKNLVCLPASPAYFLDRANNGMYR